MYGKTMTVRARLSELLPGDSYFIFEHPRPGSSLTHQYRKGPSGTALVLSVDPGTGVIFRPLITVLKIAHDRSWISRIISNDEFSVHKLVCNPDTT